jgi:hypothetical protein
MLRTQSLAPPKRVGDGLGNRVAKSPSGDPRPQDVTLGDPIAADDWGRGHQAMSANLRSMARK